MPYLYLTHYSKTHSKYMGFGMYCQVKSIFI